MHLQSIGDLAQSFALRRQNTDLKQNLDRLTRELSSGQAADLKKHLSGNFLQFSDIRHELRVLESHRTAAEEAQVDMSFMQTSLERVQTLSNDLGNAAFLSGTSINLAQLTLTSTQAAGSLNDIVSTLNSDYAGRSLFAGAEVDKAPLASSEDLLTEVRSALTGAANTADILSALDAFFDTPGGGFDSLIYKGGTDNLAPYQLGSGESVSLDLRADDPALRNVMKHTALAVVMADASFPLTLEERRALSIRAGEGLVTAQDQVTAIRGSLGYAEARVDRSVTRIAAEVTSLSIVQNNLISTDPYDTAIELETVQFQLETIYTLTARTARLSLVNFL